MAIFKIYDKATSTWFEVPIEDPTLYLLLDGARAMTGSLDMGANAITNVGNVDGRDVSVDGAKLDGIEALADVTDATNVASAGAIMDGDITGNGLMVRTGAGAYTNRSVAVADAKLTVSDGDGVAGNPTLGFGAVALADLSDVAAKSGTGTTVLMQGSPSLTTPTIADLTNMTHDHSNAAGGGNLAVAAHSHAMLDGSVHTDSVADAVTRGSLIYGNSTPKWDELVIGAAGTFLGSDGTDAAWNGTVVTAAAVIVDHAIVRGAGGARGVQTSIPTIDDLGKMSGLTRLTVDDLQFDLNVITNVGLTSIQLYPTGASASVDVLFIGVATQNRDAFRLNDVTWNASMTDTRISLAFLHAYATGPPLTAVSGRVTVGTEGNWTSTPGTQDSYMAFQMALDGVVAEKVRINSAGAMGINTTEPGGLHASAMLDIRKNALCAFAVYSFNATAAWSSRLFAGRARGTDGSPAAVVDGDWLLTLQGLGYDGAAYKTGGHISFLVDGAVSSGVVPGSIRFYTTATTAPVLRLTIQSDGDILVDSGTSVFVRDSALGFNSSVNGQFDVFADVEVEITAPLIDLNAASIFASTLASGTDQADAGVAAGELYVDTNDDNTVKRGV